MLIVFGDRVTLRRAARTSVENTDIIIPVNTEGEVLSGRILRAGGNVTEYRRVKFTLGPLVIEQEIPTSDLKPVKKPAVKTEERLGESNLELEEVKPDPRLKDVKLTQIISLELVERGE